MGWDEDRAKTAMRAEAEGHNLSISLVMLPALVLVQNPTHYSLSRRSPELDYRYNCFQSSLRKDIELEMYHRVSKCNPVTVVFLYFCKVPT